MAVRWPSALLLVIFLAMRGRGLLAAEDTGPAVPAAARQQTIVDFQDDQVLQRISKSDAITISITEPDADTAQRTLEVRVPPYSIHKNNWPLIAFGTNGRMFPEPVDVSRFSKIRVRVHNVTNAIAEVRFDHSTDDFNDGGRNLETEFFVVPGGTSMICEIATAAFEKTDPSAVRLMMILFPVNEIEAIYRFENIEAVYDPVEGSPLTRLTADLRSTRRQLQALHKTLDWNAIPKAQHEPLRAKATELITAAEQIDDECRTADATGGLRGKYRPIKTRLDGIVRQIGQFVLADKRDFYLWRMSPYTNIYRDEFPDYNNPPAESIDVQMAVGEFRDNVFMVSSCGRDLHLQVHVETSESLPAQAVAVRQAIYLPGNDGLGDAVHLLDEPLVVPENESRQVWLRFDTRYTNVRPGKHHFNVVVSDSAGGAKRSIPGTLNVWDFQLPSYDRLPNNTYSEFDNTDVGTDVVLPEAVRHMKMYGLNVMYIHPVDLPFPVTVDEQDEIVVYDSTRLEKRVKRILQAWDTAPGKEKLSFIFSISGIADKLVENGEIQWTTERWRNIFARWLARFRETTRKLGIPEDRWWFTLKDEASEAVLTRYEIPMAEMIKRMDPRSRLICNSSAFVNDPQLAKRYLDVFDVFQPSLSALETNPYLLKWFRSNRKPVWTYDAKPMLGRDRNLYEYYRVYAWKNYRYGLVGTGLWTYSAQGRSPWSDNPNGVDYSLVFRHPTKNDVVHSRRFEFYREGIDDYRYLLALKDVAKAEGPTAVQEAEELIGEAVADILANVRDTRRCDKWRIRIAERILAMK